MGLSFLISRRLLAVAPVEGRTAAVCARGSVIVSVLAPLPWMELRERKFSMALGLNERMK